MSRHEDLGRVLESGIVAIIRTPTSEQIVEVAKALYDGGVDVIEVTLTVPGAVEILSQVRRTLGDRILLGAGTVLDCESARAALLAGAEFFVSPVMNPDVIRLCHRYDKLVVPGAFTPTEVLAAWEAGADLVKVFPAGVGGADYLNALRGPLPQVRLMATGGVNLQTMAGFLDAGASAVGLGSALIDRQAVLNGEMERIRQLAGQYVAVLRSIRGRNAADR